MGGSVKNISETRLNLDLSQCCVVLFILLPIPPIPMISFGSSLSTLLSALSSCYGKHLSSSDLLFIPYTYYRSKFLWTLTIFLDLLLILTALSLLLDMLLQDNKLLFYFSSFLSFSCLRFL
ncbi:hypothetical protein AAZX31_20G110200 [Glycine max]|uniref:Uncharacterized protein n=1 Tax=Glycine max TaxID=3847 RepID=K7N317_SOYBN|nr:hypothetical protein JHK86_056031 [Glycine max]KAG4918776.1 hypothetical protein JHK85_057057 [Glycine max]KAG5074848.1 hypothetical protein JHK84_056079 [Glycine max]KAG5077508.1 hypothetical protein JHK82_056203 [Glycine max]KRG90919.1 hypothetical protein GLYMA_20G121900v4 [Glycine max]